MIRAVVWNEGLHERDNAKVREIYPDGLHEAIAAGLRDPDGGEEIAAETALLTDPEQGLPDERLAETDVLLWWGHRAHEQVDDAVAERVQKHVLAGMGLIVLHSGHFSKPFLRLMGTSGTLRWRVAGEAGERERIWPVNPGHPIARGIDDHLVIEGEEMYGEPFGVPEPDETVFISWFQGGEVFRSGLCWNRGAGKVFYFRPGHETFPTYRHAGVLRVIRNAVRWAAPRGGRHAQKVWRVPAEQAPEPVWRTAEAAL